MRIPWTGQGRIRPGITGDYPPTTPLNSSMKTGPLHPRRAPVHPIDRRASVSVLGHPSRLWTKLIPDGIQQRVDNISRHFTGAGWKNLPQELVDEILGYLMNDLLALKACSLTCKHLFGATRPLIHRQLICLGSRAEHPKPTWSLFTHYKREPGAFDRLIDADRSGVLRYAQRLTLKPRKGSRNPRFGPRDMQECLPLLRSITRWHTLTLDSFNLHPFVPVFDEYFGMFTNTLRHLDVRNAYRTEQELLYIICQFPLLEDLTIVSPASTIVPRPVYPIPSITHSPPLRGKLVLVGVKSREPLNGLLGLPGGLNFRSMTHFRCGSDLQFVSAACRHNLRSISYLWPSGGDDGEPNSTIQVGTAT